MADISITESGSKNIYVDTFGRYNGPIIVEDSSGSKKYENLEEFMSGGKKQQKEEKSAEQSKRQDEMFKKRDEIFEAIYEILQEYEKSKKSEDSGVVNIEEHEKLVRNDSKEEDNMNSKISEEIERNSDVIDLKVEDVNKNLSHPLPKITSPSQSQSSNPSESLKILFKFKNLPIKIKSSYSNCIKNGKILALLYNVNTEKDIVCFEDDSMVNIEIEGVSKFDDAVYLGTITVYDMNVQLFLVK